MIATARLDTIPDPSELAVKLAKSRVAIAALSCKHGVGMLEDEDVAYASILRDYYVQRLQASESVALDEQTVPRDDVRQILQTVLSHYGSEPSEIQDKDAIQRLLNYLNEMILRRLSKTEAAELINVLNQLGYSAPPPTYQPDFILE